MATLEQIYALKNSSSLRNRVAVAIVAAAEAVRNEASDVASHAERFSWAVSVLSSERQPESEASTDNDIQFTVNGLVNFLAGVDTSVPE